MRLPIAVSTKFVTCGKKSGWRRFREKLKIEKEVLLLIAGSCDGSFRDATKILEQAISETALTPEKLKTMIGRDGMDVARFMELMRAKKTGEMLKEIEIMEKQ